MVDQDRLERILHAAVKAPSGDNSQPWSFHIQKDKLSILVHPERDHAILNVESRGTYLSLGAVIENLVTAAAYEGFECEISYPFDVHAATVVHFIETRASTHRLSEAIDNRHTNRGPYHEHITDDALTTLRSIHAEGVRISIINDKHAIRTIAGAVSMMEEAALRTKELHQLFFQSIVWDSRRNASGAPGLYIKTTELPLPIQMLFRLIRYWSIMRALNLIGFARVAAKSNAAIYASSGAIAAISIEHTQPLDYVHAGRVFERLWLHATDMGLAAQPLAGLLYLSTYLSRQDRIHIERDLQERILDAARTIHRIFGSEQGTIAMLLRLGEPLRPATARSRRMPPAIIHSV
ncbi:MAG TPA: hypothetical protein VMU25_04285 [Candidatus Paceibacterota bacterium]|nr:hypothetical protein [Candidatus Paceibacterota bacterium]